MPDAQQSQPTPTRVELTPAGRERKRRRMRRLVVLLAVIVPAGPLLGFLSLRYGWLPDPGPSRDGGWTWVSLAVALLGVGIAVWSAIRNHKTRANNTAWNSPLLDLPARRRGNLRRQMRGRVPLNPDDTPVVRELAHATIRDARRLALPQVALFLIVAAQLIRGPGLLWGTFFGVGLAFFVVAFVILRRDTQDARTFLNAHPQPAAPTVGS